MGTPSNPYWPITELKAQHAKFPQRLRGIPNSPESLYLAGTWEWLDQIPCVAVVGTRNASDWGRDTAFELAGQIADRGWGLVSGLALGIDTAAHRGALARGGRMGATLPGGLHRIFPPENIELAADMISAGGFLMSEYAPDTEPTADFFKARDRLQSGLVMAVVVVETETDGGTMHTARFAMEHRRPLLVFDPPPGRLSNTAGNLVLSEWECAKTRSVIDDMMGILDLLIADL